MWKKTFINRTIPLRCLAYFKLFILPSIAVAQSEPQWQMPFTFEDATGARDTIYIGYDPSAQPYNFFDEEFEDYIWIDTSKFNVIIEQSSPSTGLFNYDSCKIREVVGDANFGSFVTFINGQMPITMTWDMSLMYSDQLPFPDLFPLPNAIAFVYCGAGEPGYINCPSAFDDDPLTITDQPNINYDYPINSPHLFDGSGTAPFYDEPEEVLSGFLILFFPYDTHTETISIDGLRRIKIFPNPFDEYINIQSQYIINSISITNIFGEIIYNRQINNYNALILASALPKGVYYLNIALDEQNITQTVVKP